MLNKDLVDTRYDTYIEEYDKNRLPSYGSRVLGPRITIGINKGIPTWEWSFPSFIYRENITAFKKAFAKHWKGNPIEGVHFIIIVEDKADPGGYEISIEIVRSNRTER